MDCSVAGLGTSKNNNSENREPTGDRSLDDPCREVVFSACHTSNLIDSEQEESRDNSDIIHATKGLQINMFCTKDSVSILLEFAALLQTSKVKFRCRYSEVLKEVGYCKRYGSFKLSLLNLTKTYPDFWRVLTPIHYIWNNMDVIEDGIYKDIISAFQDH